MKVINAKVMNTDRGENGVEVLVTVSWQMRKDGSQPEETEMSNTEVKKHCPHLLLDFYESRINNVF